jgi:metallo-beta-lactamase class B
MSCVCYSSTRSLAKGATVIMADSTDSVMSTSHRKTPPGYASLSSVVALWSLVLPLTFVLGGCGLLKPGREAAVNSAPEQHIELGHVRITKLAPGFWVHTSNDANGYPANGLIASTPKGLLLVDTGWTAAQTVEILDFGSTKLRSAWSGAVITHSHQDRSGGLSALTGRGIPIEGLEGTLAKLGVASTPMAGFGNVAFSSQSLVDDRGFELFFPGPGHTPDNIVVWFSAQRLLFAGCLVKDALADGLGFVGDANIQEWPKAIEAVSSRYPDVQTVVPGHGAPGSFGLLAHTLSLLAASASVPN